MEYQDNPLGVLQEVDEGFVLGSQESLVCMDNLISSRVVMLILGYSLFWETIYVSRLGLGLGGHEIQSGVFLLA